MVEQFHLEVAMALSLSDLEKEQQQEQQQQIAAAAAAGAPAAAAATARSSKERRKQQHQLEQQQRIATAEATAAAATTAHKSTRSRPQPAADPIGALEEGRRILRVHERLAELDGFSELLGEAAGMRAYLTHLSASIGRLQLHRRQKKMEDLDLEEPSEIYVPVGT